MNGCPRSGFWIRGTTNPNQRFSDLCRETINFKLSTPGKSRRWSAISPARSPPHRVIEDGLPSGVQLHQQIEFRDVAGEHHAAVFSRCEKDQCIVERLAPFVLAELLQARQQSGEDAGLAPCIPIRRENAVRRAQLDGRGNLGDRARRTRMRRVQQACGPPAPPQ